jgi:preprotein translocase subunit SecA
MISNILKIFVGRQHRHYIKKVQPIVKSINKIEKEYQSLSDEQLRAKTQEFKQRYAQKQKTAQAKFRHLNQEKQQQARLKANQEILDELLPEAFAAVKNATRRLCGQTIEICGHQMTWDMIFFDVQLIGAITLHQNKIAEMATGEGKTLVATLPLYLNALTGKNCQLVTVNDYLAKRDSEWMGYIYNMLGITVGCIRNQMDSSERREMYKCDVTYGTASEFGFDYLRDNGMASTKEDQVQRDHYFCIIDEVDSILIDESRTPLVISGPVQFERELPYREMKVPIEQLVQQQTKQCNQLVNEVQKSINANKDTALTEESMVNLLQVKYGAPKNKQFLRLMQEGQVRNTFEKYELEMTSDFNRKQFFTIKEELYYIIDEKGHYADLTEKGRRFLKPNDTQTFLLPDLPSLYIDIDKNDQLDSNAKNKAKTQAQEQFEKISEEIHCISQLLRAYSLYESDIDYMIKEGRIMIIDENTGRAMPGRRWSDGLHQAVEAKENVVIEKESRTYATITIQNYFRMYEKLAGMTGTAETELQEFRDIYKLDVIVIPPNKPIIRKDQNDIIYKTRREKYNAVIQEIKTAKDQNQPVLVGTASVEASEILSRMLKRSNITHNVLNAKFHEHEAEIITRAGHQGAVTIATNMAGRGTDIKLQEKVTQSGGLYVIGTERHTSRRIDRQLRGRSGRQGDPGKSRFFISLEDDLLRLFANSGTIGKLLEKSVGQGEIPLPPWVIENAQKRVEEQRYAGRKQLLQYDDVLNKQREVIYNLRNDAIHTENPKPSSLNSLKKK